MDIVQSRWKTRDELPALKKLGIRFDIDRLRADLQALEGKHAWDGLGAEYRNLCDAFQQLPPFFLKDGEKTDEYGSYQQLALSEFDEKFTLADRAEKSGWFWDKTHPHRNKAADERFYRKPIEGIPPYLSEVLGYFRPYLHRARFAKLLPGNLVKPHIDYDTKYSCRLHIPIHTTRECKIGVEQQDGQSAETHLEADGSVYFVNQGLKHWATNPSDQIRIHLILSVDSQRFLDV